jgi:hypothetical protein
MIIGCIPFILAFIFFTLSAIQKNTKFAYYDTRYFSPLCLVVAVLSIGWEIYG